MYSGRSIECRGPRAPTSEEQMDALRRRAWKEQGVVILHPGEIADWDERQLLINMANKAYGPRPDAPKT